MVSTSSRGFSWFPFSLVRLPLRVSDMYLHQLLIKLSHAVGCLRVAGESQDILLNCNGLVVKSFEEEQEKIAYESKGRLKQVSQ